MIAAALRLRRRVAGRTMRMRLTALYCGLFLASGAGLLILTYALVEMQSPHPFILQGPFDLSIVFVHGHPALTRVQVGQLSPHAERLRQQMIAQSAIDVRQLLLRSGIALAVMALVSIGLGWIIAGRVLRPLRTVTATVRDISASDLHRRLALTGPPDEMKELGDTFDGLLARLEHAFEAQRQFVANASHELRTPLARERTLLEVALADPDLGTEDLRRVCRRALRAGETQERLIEALLVLAGSDRGIEEREVVDLAVVAGHILRERAADLRRRTVVAQRSLAPANVLGDGHLLQRLIANLVDNAIRYNVQGRQGRITVTTGAAGGSAVLRVANTGPVVPLSEVARLFEPFRRLGGRRLAHRDGVGLGLAIVRAIATAHGATVRAEPGSEGGLLVEVRFAEAGVAHLATAAGGRREAG